MVNTIKVEVEFIKIKEVANLLQEISPDQTIILSHADHDGFASSALINSYFDAVYNQRAEIIYPSRDKSYWILFQEILRKKPKYLLIVDVVIGRHKHELQQITDAGTTIVNMDHHDLIRFPHKNYIDINPHNWGIEYLNSSGLVWLVLREVNRSYFDNRAWMAGIGAVQDYCIDDNRLLFQILQHQGLVNEIQFDQMINSNLMTAAKIINACVGLNNQKYVYEIILEASIGNSLSIILEDEKMKKNYIHHINILKGVSEDFMRRRNIYADVSFISYEFKEPSYSISLISDLCEKEKGPYIYFGYLNGILGFRALFCDYDVRKLANLFGGGGPHPKVAGAETKKGFKETVTQIYCYLQREKYQKQLYGWLPKKD